MVNFKSIKSILKRKLNSLNILGFHTPLPPIFPKNIRINVNAEINDEVPRIIWSYWESNSKDNVVSYCFESLKIKNASFEIRILTKNTIGTYLQDFPEIPKELPIANKSDLIRLMLIQKYGGIWVDASILYTESIDWIFERAKNFDFTGMYSSRMTTNMEFPIIENWILIAKKNSEFITKWLSEFKKCIFSGNPHTYYQKMSNFEELKQKMPKPEYLICYFSAQKVLRELNNTCPINLYNSDDEGHFYIYNTFPKVNYRHFVNMLLLNKIPKRVCKIIKITSESRPLLEDKINQGALRSDSIFKISISK